MLRDDRDPARYYFIPVRPGSVASFKRWNMVIISILAALVLGVLVAAVVPKPPATHAINTRISHKSPG